MKRWLAGVTGVIALVALWALPPSTFRAPQPRRSAEQAHLLAVSAEVGRHNAALRALRWADSLAELTVRTAVDGAAIGPPDVAALDAAGLRASIQRQRDARRSPPPGGELVVGLFWVPVDVGTVPGLPVAGRSTAITFVGARDGTPYCVRAVPYAGGLSAHPTRYRSDIGPCALYARYGLPGSRIQEWLDASALGFARTDDFGELGEVAAARLRQDRGPLRLFGMARPPHAGANLAVQGCLAGRPVACERALTDVELVSPRFGDEAWLVANTPASSFDGFAADAPFGYLDEGLLYEWEAEFGHEAFARFWRSSLPVSAAFESAFGEPLGDWVVAWAEEHIGLYRAGPALPAGAVGWSLLTLVVLGAFVSLAAMRRRVGT